MVDLGMKRKLSSKIEWRWNYGDPKAGSPKKLLESHDPLDATCVTVGNRDSFKRQRPGSLQFNGMLSGGKMRLQFHQRQWWGRKKKEKERKKEKEKGCAEKEGVMHSPSLSLLELKPLFATSDRDSFKRRRPGSLQFSGMLSSGKGRLQFQQQQWWGRKKKEKERKKEKEKECAEKKGEMHSQPMGSGGFMGSNKPLQNLKINK